MKRLPNATDKPRENPSTRYDADETPFTRAHAALNQAWIELGDAIARYSHDPTDETKWNLTNALMVHGARVGEMADALNGAQREAVA